MELQKLLRKKHKAINSGNESRLASICIDLAHLYCQRDEHEDAVKEYTAVAEIYRKMDKQIDYACANRMIGESYTRLRKHNIALQHLQIYLDISKKERDMLEQQRAYTTIGDTYLNKYLDLIDNPDIKLLNLALSSFLKSLSICERLKYTLKKLEYKDMRARVLINIALVKECQENYDEGIKYIQECIDICEHNDIYEQLERGYSILGSLYKRTKEYDKAIQQYNLAIEVAKRLTNKIPLKCNSLFEKANILIKLGNYQNAKSNLLKAYKLNSPYEYANNTVEMNLKIVSAMCYAEEALLKTSDIDYRKKKQLYETLGDGACSLKIYDKAIEYYQKMLEASKNNGETGSQLSPCFISLAETYNDMKQYDLAITYFTEDYKVWKDNLKECVNSLLNIIDCMDDKGSSLTEMHPFFLEARNECIKAKNQHMEFHVLSRYLVVLRKKKDSDQIAQLENDLSKLPQESVDSNNENQELSPTYVGDDISIDNITDVSDESDTEVINEKHKRKKQKRSIIKRNQKGETQLHTACIKGNIVVARHLLEQGHEVNVRDNCGWLPIHEACLHGNIEIVKLLIEKGASINDCGGTLCKGITPLHDAATNGHLEIIKLLLDKGVLTTVKDDSGDLPLQILKKWKSNQVLDQNRQELYLSIIQHLEKDAEKLGFKKTLKKENINDKQTFIASDNINYSPFQSNTSPETRIRIGSLRSRINYDKEIDESDSDNDNRNSLKLSSKYEGANEYKQVINSLRYHHNSDFNEKKRKSVETNTRSAHEIGDDDGNSSDNWLEDDLNINQQKRKKIKNDNFQNLTTMKRHNSSSSINKLSPSKNYLPKKLVDEQKISSSSIFSKKEMTEDKNPGYNIEVSNHNSLTQSTLSGQKTKQQKITKYQSDCLVTSSNLSPVKKKTNNSQYLRTSPKNVNEIEPSGRNNIGTVFSVDVHIDGKLYRVPIMASEIHICTIKWLAEEASKRYAKKESLKPTLELETKNGAILAEDDLISILFSPSTTKAEEVQAKIINWNLPSLLDRYKDACATANLATNNNLEKVLRESSTTLNLSDLYLNVESLQPICKALNRHTNLHTLIFSGNSFSIDTMQFLCASLPSLENLCMLDLSLTSLTHHHLKIFANMFIETSKPILENILNLDLSFNPLGDEGFKYLAIISRYLKLQVLNISSVNFTNDVFKTVSNRNIKLCLDYVLNLNVSCNDFGKFGVQTLLMWLNPQNIQILNISHCINCDESLAEVLLNWLRQHCGSFTLHTLNLSGCGTTDAELYELLRILESSHNLKSIIMRYNKNITSIGFRRLMSLTSVEEIDLSGCINLYKHFETCSDNTWNFFNLKHMRLYANFNKYESEITTIVNRCRETGQKNISIEKDLNGVLDFRIYN